MKKITLLTLILIVLISFSTPAMAQYRKDARVDTAPVEVYDENQSFSFRDMFNRNRFQIRNSYELSTGSYGGMGLTTGALTSSVMWRMSNKLHARADVSLLHTPFGTGDFSQALGSDSYNKLYIRNAELMYKPTANSSLHLSFHQNPGALGYGAGYGGYGYNSGYDRGFGYRPYSNRRSAFLGW